MLPSRPRQCALAGTSTKASLIKIRLAPNLAELKSDRLAYVRFGSKADLRLTPESASQGKGRAQLGVQAFADALLIIPKV